MLDKPILLVGRHPECDIQIESRKVSRRHCCIAQVGDCLIVRDLGSTNGIRINGTRMLEGKLRAGDEVTIGNNRYQVRWDEMLLSDVPALTAPPPQPATGKPTARPPMPAQLQDDPLDECDDPVALQEPEHSPVPLPRSRAKTALADKPPVLPLQPLMPPLLPSEGFPARPILPENLELAPDSNVFPAGSSPSHHPD